MINTVQNKNQINFGMKIKISNKAFDKIDMFDLMEADKYVSGNGNIHHAIFSHEGISTNASICTMGFVKPKEHFDGWFFHANPGDKVETLNEQITGAVKWLKKTCRLEEIEAFVTGANHFDEESMFKCKKILEILDDNKVDFSAIAGQKTVESLLVPKSKMEMYANGIKNECVLGYDKLDQKAFIEKKEHKIFEDPYLAKYFKKFKKTAEQKLEPYFSIRKIRTEDTITFE